ncbi:MAG: hypothetical protein ACYCZO_06725 [Daejeonella sp.]
MKLLLKYNIISVNISRLAVMFKIWSVEKANNWYKAHEWITGADFLPSTTINQLEMWQESTFDEQTIDKKLGWAENIGFNTMRVYLHSLAWKQDPNGFKQRIDRYLKKVFSWARDVSPNQPISAGL